MFETDAELWSALQQMSRTVNQVVAASKPIAKALDKMGDVASLNRQDYVADALNAIQHAASRLDRRAQCDGAQARSNQDGIG